MRRAREKTFDLDDHHDDDRTDLTTAWVPKTNFVSPTTHTPWVPHYYHEDEKGDKFAQISTLVIFVVGMTVLAIVLFQFVLKKFKEDDLPPQRQGAPPALQSLITAATRTISLPNYEDCTADEDTPLDITVSRLFGTPAEVVGGVLDPPTYQEFSDNSKRYRAKDQNNRPSPTRDADPSLQRLLIGDCPVFIDVEPATPSP